MGVPRQNFWVGQMCGLRPTFYKRFMAYNSQHWDTIGDKQKSYVMCVKFSKE